MSGGAWQVAPRVRNIIQDQYSASERGLSVSFIMSFLLSSIVLCKQTLRWTWFAHCHFLLLTLSYYSFLLVPVYQGNEDAGQMSAWLVMSSLGIYQVCPGCGTHSTRNSTHSTVSSTHSTHSTHRSTTDSRTTQTNKEERVGSSVGGGEYVLNAPLFDNITVTLPMREDSEGAFIKALCCIVFYTNFSCFYLLQVLRWVCASSFTTATTLPRMCISRACISMVCLRNVRLWRTTQSWMAACGSTSWVVRLTKGGERRAESVWLTSFNCNGFYMCCLITCEARMNCGIFVNNGVWYKLRSRPQFHQRSKGICQQSWTSVNNFWLLWCAQCL